MTKDVVTIDNRDTVVETAVAVEVLATETVTELVVSSNTVEVITTDVREVVASVQEVTEILTVGEQGPQGTKGEPGSDGATVFSRVNVTPWDMLAGQPVYAVSDLAVGLADASQPGRQRVVGLVYDTLIASQGGTGRVMSQGMLAATINDWQQVTGMVGGLVPNADYFLDIVAGRITPFAPIAEARFLCLIGRAVSQTELFVRIEPPITL